MTKVTGAELIARMVDGYGVSHIFMVPAIIRRALAAMDRIGGMTLVQTHTEPAAAYMADGYARALRRPGICMAQHVGSLNLAAGLRDAWLGRSPVIAITGGRDSHTAYRGAYQDVDDFDAFTSITKLNATIDQADRIPDMFRRAFRTAVSGNPGPVHLRLRGLDGQLETDVIDEIETICEPRFASLPPFRPEPTRDDVRAVLDHLFKAQRPVIVAGGGIYKSDAAAELLQLAEMLSIPVATSLNGKGSFPGTHRLALGVVGSYSRECANRAVSEADLVCYIGSSIGGMTTHFWQLPPPGTQIVQIDLDPESIGRNFCPVASALGDAKVTLALMCDLAREASVPQRPSWMTRVDALTSEWRARFSEFLNSDAVPIRPERICAELTRHAPDDAIILADTGHSGMWMGGMFDLRSPRQSYIRSQGHLGWSFPASIGAKFAAPDRPVIVFTGDSAFWYHFAELETAVRLGVNLITVVNNNRSGNQSRRAFDRAWDGKPNAVSDSMWKFHEVNFARIAEEIGAAGLRVERPGDLAPAIEKALGLKRPVVIDVVSDIEAVAPLAFAP